jgi:hypothetical protein
LAEKKPVIWYREQHCYLFVEEGVYQKPDNFLPSYFKTIIWTLVDSDVAVNGVPEHLATHDTHHYVVYVTSPAKDRWSRMDKTMNPIVVVMNPWTKKEMHYALVVPCLLYLVVLMIPTPAARR